MSSDALGAGASAGDDSFEGDCNICGEHQTFVRASTSLREGYACLRCRASLRYRGQAETILRTFSTRGATSIAELMTEPEFKGLCVWEPGVLGPFRSYFGQLPGYTTSAYWPDVALGDQRDGVRCEDLMRLTFADTSFDLVVTSDVFEHVRKPYLGFAEVHRVLRPGGRHVFSIPVQEPLAALTVERVDTASADDVFLLEPQYHHGHLVYNDFGRDLVTNLDGLGFDTEIERFASSSAVASRLVTFCSTKR